LVVDSEAIAFHASEVPARSRAHADDARAIGEALFIAANTAKQP
jgi:hypothetical protein